MPRRAATAGRGIVSRRGSRAAGQRASPHRRADRGALPGDGPRHGAFRSSTGLQTTLIAMRARRQAGRRPTDRLADLLRLPALPRRLHDRGARRGGGLRRLDDHQLQPAHVRVCARGPHGAAPRAARSRQPGARARAADRPPAAAGWLGRRVPPSAAACEVAGMLADRVGAPASVPGLLAYLTERWDGQGPLRRAKGEQIPLPMRIVHVATDAAFQRLLGGAEHAVRPRARARRARVRPGGGGLPGGRRFEDPRARRAAPRRGRRSSPRSRSPPLVLEGEALDRALAAMGSFADLISPYLAGHSAGVAELAGAAAQALRDRRGGCDGDPAGRASSTTSAGSRSTRGSGRSPGR